jgi:hypothetical protein
VNQGGIYLGGRTRDLPQISSSAQQSLPIVAWTWPVLILGAAEMATVALAADTVNDDELGHLNQGVGQSPYLTQKCAPRRRAMSVNRPHTEPAWAAGLLLTSMMSKPLA